MGGEGANFTAPPRVCANAIKRCVPRLLTRSLISGSAKRPSVFDVCI